MFNPFKCFAFKRLNMVVGVEFLICNFIKTSNMNLNPVKSFLILCIAIAIVALPNYSKAQTGNPFKKTALLYLNSDSSVSVRLIGLAQLHARYIQLNEGSIGPDNQKTDANTDLAISRICVGTVVSAKKLTLYYLLGTASQTVTTGRLGNFYTYESWISYQLIPKYFTLGTGLSLYNGLSRYSSLSISQLLQVEPIWSALPTAARTDQFGRQFQVFGIGNIGRFEYRTALVRPFIIPTPALDQSVKTNISFEYPSNKFGVEGYYSFQFFDLEDIRNSAKSFAYLGKKKIFNIGFGFEYQPRAAVSLTETRQEEYHNTLSRAADLTLDIPTAKGGSFSIYAVGFNYDYGPNFARTIGTMNYFTGGTGAQGAGNNEFFVGTGKAAHIQIAYLFGKPLTKLQSKIQAYYTATYKSFEALKDPSLQHSIGLNYYIFDHNAKIGLQYVNRPEYTKDLELDAYKSSVLMQLQVTF